jgi:hypothetical protein
MSDKAESSTQHGEESHTHTLIMSEITKKRTLDSFFKPSAKKIKAAEDETPEESEIEQISTHPVSHREDS